MEKKVSLDKANELEDNELYSVGEISQHFGITRTSVLSWIQNGLQCIKKGGQLYLIRGKDVKQFLQDREKRKKKITLDKANELKDNELYSISEINQHFGISNVIYKWIRNGLPYIRKGKFYLVRGKDLKKFLQDREKSGVYSKYVL